MHKATIPVDLTTSIATLADQCVKCGLCLPHCPTYNITHNEADSPRGRIALCQALVSGLAGDDTSVLPHLQSCLLCRNCERVCPSGVAYQRIYSDTFARLRLQHGYTQSSWTGKIIAQPRWLRLLQTALWIYQRSGLQWLLRATGLLRLLRLDELENYLPPVKLRALPASLTSTHHSRGTIAIFTGCVGRIFEHDAIRATAQLAVRAGYQVEFVPAQRCCGALHYAHGDHEHALALARDTIGAFNPSRHDAIVFLSSGCGAQLQTYAELPWPTSAEQENAKVFVSKLHEACAWVVQHSPPPATTTSSETVLWHQPCSHRNVVGHVDVVGQLLQQIPGLQVVRPDVTAGCCGGAGDYPLRQPEMTAQVRAPLLDSIIDKSPGTVVTTNVGCVLSIAAGLREQGKAVRVVHPLVLYCENINTTT